MKLMGLISSGRPENVNYSSDKTKNIELSFKGGIKGAVPDQTPWHVIIKQCFASQ